MSHGQADRKHCKKLQTYFRAGAPKNAANSLSSHLNMDLTEVVTKIMNVSEVHSVMQCNAFWQFIRMRLRWTLPQRQYDRHKQKRELCKCERS